MIYVRDDDAIMFHSEWPDPVERFIQVHEWIMEVPDLMTHVPTILWREIQDYPEGIEYIREETERGTMVPQLHGWEHRDYGTMAYMDVVEMLVHSKRWMKHNIEVWPTKWYTPWGANQAHLHRAAAACGLELVNCEDRVKMVGREGVIQKLRYGADPFSFLDEKELFVHWWSRTGSRVEMVVKTLKNGKWDEKFFNAG